MTKPVLIQAAIVAVINMLVLLSVLHLTEEQLAGINIGAGAILAAIVGWFNPNIPWYGEKVQ